MNLKLTLSVNENIKTKKNILPSKINSIKTGCIMLRIDYSYFELSPRKIPGF